MPNSYNNSENKRRRDAARRARQQRLQKLNKAINKAKDKVTPKNTIGKTNKKLAAPKNNIKTTGAPIDSQKLKSEINRMSNDLKRSNRRDYIARTTKAGVDEFNNTTIRAKKGGAKVTTGDLAKFNKNRLISQSAKPTLRGGAVGLALTGLQIAGSQGLLGKKVQKSIQDSDKAEATALNNAKQRLRQLSSVLKPRPIKARRKRK